MQLLRPKKLARWDSSIQMWVTGRTKVDWYKWLLNKIQVVTRWTLCTRRSKQRKQAICKQTDWLQRGSEGQRRQTADQRWNFPWGHKQPSWIHRGLCEKVWAYKGARRKKGIDATLRQCVVSMIVFPCKMLRMMEIYYTSDHPIPSRPPLSVLTNVYKSAFQYIHV